MIFKKNVSLREFNTFKIGGDAKYFCVVGTVNDLKEAIFFAKEKKLLFFVLGGGSNTLFSDEGFDGLIIKMEISGRNVEKISKDTICLNAMAGENWDDLVKFVMEDNFYGIENLSGIPGTVGGAAIQNIGAYGAEAADSIVEVEVFDALDMKTKTLSAKECLFSYRDSIFKKPEGRKYIVTRVLFSLKKNGKLNTNYKDIALFCHSRGNGNPDSVVSKEITLKDLRSAILEIRSKKFPDLKIYSTAGSFFKNPTVSRKFYEQLREKYPQIPAYEVGDENFRIPLAWILDKVCGLKGFRKGKVGLYENQSLVLVNFGGASANDIKKLADEITRTVKAKIGIEIELEVVYA